MSKYDGEDNPLPDLIGQLMDSVIKQEGLRVRLLAEEVGYGFLMQAASIQWAEKDDIGAFVVGPCKSQVVECGCELPHECDWCAGSGWLTRHVKEVKDNQDKPYGAPLPGILVYSFEDAIRDRDKAWEGLDRAVTNKAGKEVEDMAKEVWQKAEARYKSLRDELLSRIKK